MKFPTLCALLLCASSFLSMTAHAADSSERTNWMRALCAGELSGQSSKQYSCTVFSRPNDDLHENVNGIYETARLGITLVFDQSDVLPLIVVSLMHEGHGEPTGHGIVEDPRARQNAVMFSAKSIPQQSMRKFFEPRFMNWRRYSATLPASQAQSTADGSRHGSFWIIEKYPRPNDARRGLIHHVLWQYRYVAERSLATDVAVQFDDSPAELREYLKTHEKAVPLPIYSNMGLVKEVAPYRAK